MSRDFIVQAQVIKREAPYVQVGNVVTIVGKDGSLIYTAAGVPSNSLGVYTDLYIDTVAPNNFYQKNASNVWVLKGSLKGISGDDGREVLIQNNGTYIQWQYEGDTEWTNIVELSTLKGDTGSNIELNKSATHIQWRVVGDADWIDLVALADLKGDAGYTPQKGIDYFDGRGIVSFELIDTQEKTKTYRMLFTDATYVDVPIIDGNDGADGVGISNIEKTSTVGIVDTYTITYTDGTTSTFDVTNGIVGKGIVSIIKTSTVGLVDTYTITYTDSTTSTFDVTNGEKGEDGTSAYEIYIAGGGTLSEVDFNASITDIPTHITDATKHIDTTTAEFSGTIDETNDKFTIWDNSLLKWIRFSFTSLKTYLNGIYHKFGGSSFGAKQIIGSTDNQDFGIITNNTERLTVLKNGNVGIGITNPATKLEIFNIAAGFNSQAEIRGGNSATGDVASLSFSTSVTSHNWGYVGILRNDPSACLIFGVKYAGGAVLVDEKMRIYDNGYVGIGTPIPRSKLQVAGGIQCGDDTAAASADKVGTRRNRTGVVGNVGFYVSEECSQKGVNEYEWTEIFRNEWIIP